MVCSVVTVRLARQTLSALGISLLLVCPAVRAHERNISADALFELSLDELVKVQVTGAAVRDLGLDQMAATGNPFHWQIQDVAASVETIDHNTMQARGLNTVIEAAENLVGVLSGDSPAEPHSFSMRGFSRDSISVLHDGISMGISTLNTRPQASFNLDRLEISKGAATLQHGQGSAGGSINFISRKPVLGTDTIAETLVEYGNYQSSMLGIGVNGPLAEHAAYRFDLSRTGSAGWVDDTDAHSLQLTGAVRWQPAADLDVRLALNYLDDELPAYWGTPLIPRALARDPVAGVVSTDDDRVIDAAMLNRNYNVADHEISSESLLTRFDIEQQLSEQSHWQLTLYHVSADRNWRNAESYNFNPTTELVERDRFLVQHDRRLSGLRSGLATQHSLAGLSNQLAINLEYSDNDFARNVGFDADNPEPFVDTVDPYQPEPGRFGNVDIRPDATRTQITALVVEDALQLAPHWRLDLAVRQEQIALDRGRLNFDGAPIARTLLDERFHQQSYRAGLLHQLGAGTTVYSHVSKQHDPFESDISNVFVASNFKPSDVEQLELGLKSLFADQQVELTAAWFAIKKDQRIQRSDRSFARNEQQSQGWELALRAALSDDIRVGGNIAYTDTDYDAFYDAVTDANVDGNRPVNAPEWMASLWTSINRIGALPIELGGGINYVSERFADSANSITLHSYALVNAFIAYAEERYRVAFNIRNASDETYAPWSDTTYPNQISLGAPRRYELNLQVKF